MDLRQRINEKPLATAVVTAGVLVLAAVVIGRSACNPANNTSGFGGKVFFTIDDGKTYFPGDLDNIPPYTTPDGKTAYRAVVVKCGNGQPYVSHLERYSPNARAKIVDAIKNPEVRSVILPEIQVNALSEAEVKKPLTGDKGWLNSSARQYEGVARPKCADGADAETVLPQ